MRKITSQDAYTSDEGSGSDGGTDEGAELLLERLGQLQGLTSLRINAAAAWPGSVWPKSNVQPLVTYDASALAECLQQLTQLQHLHVAGKLRGSQAGFDRLRGIACGIAECELPQRSWC